MLLNGSLRSTVLYSSEAFQSSELMLLLMHVAKPNLHKIWIAQIL